MASTTAISAQTTAATSSNITLGSNEYIQIWTSSELAAGEYVDIYRTSGGSPDVEVLVRESLDPRQDHDGRVHFAMPSTGQLNSKRVSLMLSGPGIFRLKKSITVASVAVFYDA